MWSSLPVLVGWTAAAPLWSFEEVRDLPVGMGGQQGRHDWQNRAAMHTL